MENAKFISFCILNGVLIILSIAMIIGITVADHMRAVRRSTQATYTDKMSKAKALKDDDFDAVKNAKVEDELAAKRQAELDTLNKTFETEADKALKDRLAVHAEEIKQPNEIIVAPMSAEKYTTDPQFKLNYFNGDSTRAFETKDNFAEKFQELTRDGVFLDDE